MSRLAERSRRRQHAGVVRCHRLGGGHLLWPQLASERHVQGPPALTFVAGDGADAEVGQFLAHVVQTAARYADVLRVVLGTGNDARLVVRGQPHRLRFVELRILEGRDPEQTVPQPWIQAVLGNVDLIGVDEFQGVGHVTDNRRVLATT